MQEAHPEPNGHLPLWLNWLEHPAFNRRVLGSSPRGGTYVLCLESRNGRKGIVLSLDKALGLAQLGIHVFPVSVRPDPKRKGKFTKHPRTSNGFYSGTDDPTLIRSFDWDGAEVGVWAGPSGLCVLDIDIKRDESGEITVDGYTNLDDMFLEPDVTFTYSTASGEGTHFVYSVEPGTPGLNGRSDYRNINGVDRRAGNSFFVWYGDVPGSRSELEPAPEWLLDAAEVRSRAAFDGSTEEWFAALEPGQPNVLVRRAIDRVRDDFSHSEMVSAQHEAIRLGAEGNPGVPELLTRLEEAWLNRDPSGHGTPESEWGPKFAEALASGIVKYGDAIELRKSLPPYTPALIPAQVLDSLVTGTPGDRQDFNALLRALTQAQTDPLVSTSILWNCAKTRDLAREWGLQFVHQRVLESEHQLPPERENPSLERKTVVAGTTPSLLRPDEIELVLSHPTFIDEYVDASRRMKGWVNLDYAIPMAWTLLSSAFGYQAFLPMSKPIPLNLWFITMGESGTGKTAHFQEMSTCLDLLLKQPEETYFNLGAGSSPEAMHEALLERDKKVSAVIHDEASDFFENLSRKDWMSGLKDNLAKWYDGYVPPVQKVRLKELKGRSAQTSLGLDMLATPDRLLTFVNLDMWYSGFLARVNWGFASAPDRDDKRRFQVARGKYDDGGVNPLCYDLVGALVMAQRGFKSDRVSLDWTEEAEALMIHAHMMMDKYARSRDNYQATEPAITRLARETVWKCAGLLALYRGERVIRKIDALTALYYAQTWFDNLFKVVDAAGNGEFVKNMALIEQYVGQYPHGVTDTKVYDKFANLVRFGGKRDIDLLLDYLMSSGRIVRDTHGGKTKYLLNGADNADPK